MLFRPGDRECRFVAVFSSPQQSPAVLPSPTSKNGADGLSVISSVLEKFRTGRLGTLSVDDTKPTGIGGPISNEYTSLNHILGCLATNTHLTSSCEAGNK